MVRVSSRVVWRTFFLPLLLFCAAMALASLLFTSLGACGVNVNRRSGERVVAGERGREFLVGVPIAAARVFQEP